MALPGIDLHVVQGQVMRKNWFLYSLLTGLAVALLGVAAWSQSTIRVTSPISLDATAFGVTNGMVSLIPSGRVVQGAAAGSGVNAVTDYLADNTGGLDATTAVQNATAAACAAAGTIANKEFVFPAGLYKMSGEVIVPNGCDWHGQNTLGGGANSGATILRYIAGSVDGKTAIRCETRGQCKIHDLRIDSPSAQQKGGAKYARVHAGGSGYAVNDTITLTGGTFTTATVIKVTVVSGGAVTGAVIQTPGAYSVAPSPMAPVAQGSTSGSGTGATFDVVYANAAAIELSGPVTTLTADASSGATSITVASIAGFVNGDQISIEQDDGTYKTTTISGAPSGNTITLAAGLTFKASTNHPVYDTYNTRSELRNLVLVNFWDGVRIENAGQVKIDNVLVQDFSHDGVIKLNGANPDYGDDSYGLTTWDLNVGTSNAGLELLAGGTVQVAKMKALVSNYSVLLNSYFGPTGTLIINGGSFEEAKTSTFRLHQSISGVEYANIVMTGAQMSNITNVAGRHLMVDAGTPNTAPKWVRNIVFDGDASNDVMTGSLSVIDIEDGDNITLSSLALNNNGTAGPNAIKIGSGATNVRENGNGDQASYPSGFYGTVADAAMVPVIGHGGIKQLFNTAAIQHMWMCDNADVGGAGCDWQVLQGGALVWQGKLNFLSGHWHYDIYKGALLTQSLLDDGSITFNGTTTSNGATINKLGGALPSGLLTTGQQQAIGLLTATPQGTLNPSISYGNPSAFFGWSARGTPGSEAPLQLNDPISIFGSGGFGTTANNLGCGGYTVRAGGTWSDASTPTYVTIDTTPVGSPCGAAPKRVWVQTDGGVEVGTGGAEPTGGSKGTGTINIATTYYAQAVPSSTAAQSGALYYNLATGQFSYDPTNPCLTSSLRFKRDVKPFDSSLGTVLALKPASFRFREEYATGREGEQIGLIAEDVAMVDPRLVSYDPDGQPRAWNQSAVIAELVGAIQQQQGEIFWTRVSVCGLVVFGVIVIRRLRGVRGTA